MSEEFIKTAASLVGISTVAAISRSILSEERRTLKGFFRASFLAVFVGGITAGLIQDYHFSSEAQGAVVGLCAFVADDILLLIVNLATWFRQDPTRIIKIVLNRRWDDPPEGKL